MAKKNKSEGTIQVVKKPLSKRIWNYRGFYLMFLPVFIFVIVTQYWPMLGIRFSFYEYKVSRAPIFVGMKNFNDMFSDPIKQKAFLNAFKNTLQISIIKLLITTFSSVVVSILLNEMANLFAKKVLQTVIYLPHFMSWVVTASIFSLILAPTANGMVNTALQSWGILGETQYIYFLNDTKWWRFVYYIINIWKETGWGTIIFLATLSGINPELYEAADIDGATRFQKMQYVTLPALANTIITVLILNLAKVMNLFESVLVFWQRGVNDVADVISTYIYRTGLAAGATSDYGFTTAVGLFKSLVGCVLVLVCNWASKKVRGRGIV